MAYPLSKLFLFQILDLLLIRMILFVSNHVMIYYRSFKAQFVYSHLDLLGHLYNSFYRKDLTLLHLDWHFLNNG